LLQHDLPRRRAHRVDAGARRRVYSTFAYDKAKKDPPLFHGLNVCQA
jgi:hypothetical protein